MVLTITLTGDRVSPNAETIDVRKGQTVVLRATSDHVDEIHAHTAGDGVTLAVAPGKTTTAEFVASDTGSFEVEAHESGLVIAILNVR